MCRPKETMKIILLFIFTSCVLFNLVTSQIAPANDDIGIIYQGELTKCNLANAIDILIRPLLSSMEARSQMDCLQKCFDTSQCEIVLFNNSKSCLLLGPPQDAIVNNVDLRGDSCSVVYLNPCYNGGVYSYSMCQCPASYTGQYCQLVNDDRCNYPFQMIHGYVQTFEVDDYEALSAFLAPNFKIAFVTDEMSYLTIGPAQFHFLQPTTDIWVAEVQNIISKSSLSSYSAFPHFEGYVMTHNGTVRNASVYFNGTLAGKEKVDGAHAIAVIARAPVSEYVVRGEGAPGTVDDVITAILQGCEPLRVATMTFDIHRGQVIEHKVKVELATRPSTRIISPVHYINEKIDLLGNQYIYRQFINGDSDYTTKHNVYNDIVFDPCWFDATVDLRNAQMDKSIDYLKTALRNGKRARVVFDGISGKTQATYITKDYVLFQVSPYLSPKNVTFMDNLTNVVHSVVATDGRVKTCAHRMLNSAATSQSEYLTNDLRWFVDSRTWKLMYETDLDGFSLNGDLATLEYHVNDGVDVQIVVETPSLTFSFPGGWMTTDPLAYSQHDVSAEVKDLLQLWVHDTDFGFIETGYCTFSSILLSTELGWRALSYKYGNPIDFNTFTLGAPYGTIKWFVSGYEEGELPSK